MPIIDSYTLLGAWPEMELDLTVEALAAGMQARSVARSLVTHTTAIFYDAAIGNDLTHQLCGQYAPLVPVAVVQPLAYPACLEEIRRQLERGVRVFRFCPREHGYPLRAEVGPLRAALEALASARLLLVDVAELPHPVLGADLAPLLPVPTAFSTDAAGLGEILEAGRRSPNVWVETSRLTAGGALEAAARHLGAERVIFGSGAPLRSLGSAVMSVQYAELSDADRQAIFEGNLLRLLG